jgi:hypothetical protein
MADRPTPLSIAVCALIALNADPSSALNQLEHDENQEKQLISILHQAILPGVPKRQTVASFAREIQQAASPQTASLFQKCLKRLSVSLDAMVDFFSSLQSAVSDGTIDGASAQGVFVRRTSLGFDTLSFEGITRLWESLKLQVQEMTSTPALVEEEKTEKDEISVVDELWPLSPLQMEAILRQQCTRLEQTNHSFEETECQIRRVMACDPELPAAHFLRFLNCLRHSERVGALDALHQYFDYAMIKARKDATTHHKKKVHDVAQYASILLAALHHAFGDESLSLKATEEAVRVSQESRDPASVAYALGWLYCNEMKLNAQDLLERCASRASEGHLRPLVAGVNSALARHLLGTETSSATSAWTSLANATTDPPPSSTTNSLDRPTHTADVTSSDEAMELLSRQILVGAGIWQAFGLNALSGLSSLVNMNVHDKHLSPHETALAVRNLARVSLYGSVPEAFQLVEHDFSTASPCRYATALRLLMNLHESQKQSDTIYSTALVLHEWAVRRGDLEHAEFLTKVLHSYLHPRMPNYKAAYVETMLQHVLLLSRQEQWDKAKELAKKLCATCQEEGCGLRVQHATLLIQLALIQLESSSQNFVGALPPLFECLTMCETCAMDSIHATALSILAQVHLRMENTKQAIAVLKATLPSLHQHSHVWFVGEAYLTLAKCHLQQAKKENAKDAKKKKKLARMLQSAVDSLNKSADSFRECDDAARLREVYYLQAHTYNSLPDMKEQRNEASKRFVKVSRNLEKGRFSWQRGSLSDMSHLEQLASRLPVDS